MVYSNTNDNDEIEVDGIFFKTLMPERVVTIPPKQSDAKTAVRFGIQITNSQANSQRFLLFFMRPEFIQANQQKVSRSGPVINASYNPLLSDFRLVKPGEIVTFLEKGYFRWASQKLILGFYEKDGASWGFSDFNSGTYGLQVIYENQYSAWEQTGYRNRPIDLKPVWENPNHNNPRSDIIKMKNVWMGEVHTPPVEFQLVKSEIKFRNN